MTRGKISARVPRRKRNSHDLLLTIIGTDLPEAEIMRMTPRQRCEARREDERKRQSPGFRDWSAESMAVYLEWERLTPGVSFYDFLRSIDRLDLSRNINRADGYTCGKCGRAHNQPFCIRGETKWLCFDCTKGRPAQTGSYSTMTVRFTS